MCLDELHTSIWCHNLPVFVYVYCYLSSFYLFQRLLMGQKARAASSNKVIVCFFYYDKLLKSTVHWPILHLSLSSLVWKGDVPLSYIVDQGNRTAWITEKVNLAKSQFMDGINLDIEQAVEEGSPEYHALTDLVKETTETFHREIPGSQVRKMFWQCHSE